MIEFLAKISYTNIEVTDSNVELNEEFESLKSEPKKVLQIWKLIFIDKLNRLPKLFGIQLYS